MRRLKVTFKRRRKGKTDYAARAALLKAGLPRLVVRKTNKYIIAQLVESKEAQDFVLCTANSAELKRFGWQGSFKSTGAAYLTGFLAAKKTKVKAAVADLGLYRSTKGSRVYAAIKGAHDGGLKINYAAEMAPSDERIRGKLTQEAFEAIKEKIKENKGKKS